MDSYIDVVCIGPGGGVGNEKKIAAYLFQNIDRVSHVAVQYHYRPVCACVIINIRNALTHQLVGTYESSSLLRISVSSWAITN